MGKRKLTNYGMKVKKRLVDLEMTQVQLAEAVGTSKNYLNLILHGDRSGDKYVERIVKVLKFE